MLHLSSLARAGCFGPSPSLPTFSLRPRVKQRDALAKKIVALLPDHETLTLSQIVKLTKGKPSTVKLRLKELVEKGYLVPKGQGRGAHYVRGENTHSAS